MNYIFDQTPWMSLKRRVKPLKSVAPCLPSGSFSYSPLPYANRTKSLEFDIICEIIVCRPLAVPQVGRSYFVVVEGIGSLTVIHPVAGTGS